MPYQPKSLLTICVKKEQPYHHIILHFVTHSATSKAKRILTMKLEDIDQFFKDRQTQLNQMPPGEVWNRLEQRLQEQPIAPQTGKSVWFLPKKTWRVAAAVVLLFVASVIIYQYVADDTAEQNQELALQNLPQNTNETVAAIEEEKSMMLASPADTYANRNTEPDLQLRKIEQTNSFSEKRAAPKPKPETEAKRSQEAAPAPPPSYPPSATPATPATPATSAPATNAATVRNPTTNTYTYIALTRYNLALPPNETLADNEVSENLEEEAKYSPETNTASKPVKAKSVAPNQTTDTNKPKPAPAATPTSLFQINNLWNQWQSKTAPQLTEKWSSTGKGVITLSRGYNTIIYTEEATISKQQNQLIYTITHPTTKQKTDYYLQPASTAQKLIFANDTVPYPSTITYQFMSNSTLQVVFSGKENGSPKTQTITLFRQY